VLEPIVFGSAGYNEVSFGSFQDSEDNRVSNILDNPGLSFIRAVNVFNNDLVFLFHNVQYSTRKASPIQTHD